MLRLIKTVSLACLLLLCASASAAAQQFTLTSGGAPSITGALGGNVSGSTSQGDALAVTINFGEVSPVNTNGMVKVVVPVAIRSSAPYQVTASVTGGAGAGSQGVRLSDVGLGLMNMQAMGSQAQVCSNSPHIISALFNNDPASAFSLDANGRIAYQSSLANIAGSTVILSGPTLTRTNPSQTHLSNGYTFDAVLVIAPQFYATGSYSLTLTLTISAGPNVNC